MSHFATTLTQIRNVDALEASVLVQQSQESQVSGVSGVSGVKKYEVNDFTAIGNS